MNRRRRNQLFRAGVEAARGGKMTKASKRIEKERSRQLDKMLRNARDWRTVNPDVEVKIQFNYPRTVALIACISDAIEQKYVVTNEAGLEMIKALAPWGNNNEPTVFMVRAVVESLFEGNWKPQKGYPCPQCGIVNYSHDAIRRKDETTPPEVVHRPTPVPGSIMFCVTCDAINLLEEGDKIRTLSAEEIKTLPQEAQDVVAMVLRAREEMPQHLRRKLDAERERQAKLRRQSPGGASTPPGGPGAA